MSGAVEVSAAFVISSLRRENVEALPPREIARLACEKSFDEGVCFMVTNDEDRYRIASAATLALLEGEAREILEKEFKLLSMLAAATSGIPVDWSVALEDEPTPEDKQIGMLKIFKEVQAAQ